MADILDVVIGRAQGELWSLITARKIYGIFKDGVLQVEADSVVEAGNRAEWRVSDYPVAPNSFASYDKVQTPGTVTLRLTKSGTPAQRVTFMDSIVALCDQPTIVDVVMDERTITGYTVVSYDLLRAASSGFQMLTVDIRLQQVREGTVVAFSETKSASGADDVETGRVRPQ